jgi:ABC-type multidrug transport system ATPase subunit
MEETHAISVANLSVEAGPRGRRKKLISDFNFEIGTGQFVAIVGASGCGKSTLLKTLAGQIPPSSGRVLFAGHPIAELKNAFPLAVGYIPQFGAFHGDLTVEENLLSAVALRLPASVPVEVKQRWMRHIVELAGLEPLLGQPYRTLSGGQMRRMALAEELIGDPAFLLLDELTSGLDAFSDREIMRWLHDLARTQGKTVVLVTHATYHLDYCDAVLFVDGGRQVEFAPLAELLASHQVDSVSDLFEVYHRGGIEFLPPLNEPEPEIAPQPLKTARPPGGWAQLPTLLARHFTLFWRDRTQLWLHLALAITFPALVAVFAMNGLPQVRQLTLKLESNIVQTLAEQLLYLPEAFHAASLVSGLAMFQVILLTLIGANNGAREIARERDVLVKERRAGLSSFAYLLTKFIHVVVLSALQAFWMAWFVKTMCNFPGALLAQFGVLFATTLAMSTTCLAISAASRTPERASLLAIYVVGFQLPLSGAALSLPAALSVICRPFVAAYWGWSGYLKTLENTRHYDIVAQSTDTSIAPYGICMIVLGLHTVVAFLIAWRFVVRTTEN